MPQTGIDISKDINMSASITDKIKIALREPKRVVIYLLCRIAPIIPDKLFLKWLFRLRMGYKLNLDNPQTFSEKLQWLKLYNRKPEYTQMVDKFEAKKYVASIIGEEYIIPTLGVWDSVDDIDFDALPEQFVLKTTHGGGNTGVVICRDKSTFDIAKAKAKLQKSLKSCIYRQYREWPYKNVKRRIIAEALIGNGYTEDYKFFCFEGEVKLCQVISGRESTMTIDFYDKEWNHQPFHEPKAYPFSKRPLRRPALYDKMWEVAQALCKNQHFIRIDLYAVNDQIYFGELTFFPTSGMGGFEPQEWDYKFGEWIKLPEGI